MKKYYEVRVIYSNGNDVRLLSVFIFDALEKADVFARGYVEEVDYNYVVLVREQIMNEPFNEPILHNKYVGERDE